MKKSNAVERFGKAVQEIRLRSNKTLEDLALDIGIDAAHLSRIERGQKNIALATAAKIASALDRDLMFDKIKLT